MIFEDFLTKKLLNDSCHVLGVSNPLTDLTVTRLNSLEMPPRETFKVLEIMTPDGVPFANNVGLHNEQYKLNYGARLCQLVGTNIRFVLRTTYSVEFGEICIILNKKNEAFQTIRTFKRAKKANLVEISAPILEHEMIHKVEQNTLNFVLKAKKRKLHLQRGLLFHGEPGNGKSLMCDHIRKMAQNAQLDCTNIKGKDAASKNIEGSFKDINFLDDIEINLLDRSKGGVAASDFLSAIDGIVKDGPPKAFIFTTNEQITDIESAFIRPGRIDMVLEFKKPTPTLRRRLILEKYYSTMKARVLEEKKVDWLVDATHDFSFAEIVGINNLMLIYDMDDKYISVEDAYYQFVEDMEMKKGLQRGGKGQFGFGTT